ncbi:MAG: prepilin-type N-terminal cleavage/methylation domain-containing protein [Synergistaceae bacterium]|nr:prepilin-type N-terminal cleavage/methylation domain-containing protein [Synergistaceae bacterium]
MANIHKGFTLIEILIVVTFTGVLSTVLTLSNINAETTAQARRVISRLQSARVAVLSGQRDGKKAVRVFDGCMILRTEDGLYAGCELDDNEWMRSKLADRAEVAGLLERDMKTPYTSGGEVWIQILSSES